jgi:hypothetical protein
VTCGTCNGDGTVRCGPCEATGWRYYRAWLRAIVSHGFTVRAATAHEEPQQFLATVDNLADLCRLAERVIIDDQSSDDDSIQRTFSGTVAVTTLSLTAAGTPFEIVGYGDPPQVYDYKNLVGCLLQTDLNALESTLRRTPKYPPWPNRRLEGELATFLQSTANRRIGERGAALSPAQLERLAAEEFQQAVSADYATRAVGAIRSGIERAYRSGMLLAVPALLLAPTAILVPANQRGLIHFGPLPALVVGTITLLVALLLERIARYRLRRRFGPALGAALPALLDASGMALKARKRYRRSAIFGALIGWIGGAFLVAFLYIRAHQPQAMRAQMPRTLHATRSTVARHRAPSSPKPVHHKPLHKPHH